MHAILACQTCQRCTSDAEPRWRCDCGGLLDIGFEARFPRDQIERRPPNLWRYREALPIHDDHAVVSLGEGFTPLLPLVMKNRLVMVKAEQLLPTGSFKDRGAAVLVSKLKELGIKRVVEDSSGNAGSALAAYCAQAGIACRLFVPATTSQTKQLTMKLFGARIELVPGSRQAAAQAALRAAGRSFYASHSWNPYFLHGTKTVAYEICEQLGWNSPDVLVAPVGNGTLLLGLQLGFEDLRLAGVVKRAPRLIGVQAAACSPLATAFRRGSTSAARVHPKTSLAEGIAVSHPVRQRQILEAVRDSDGDFVTVTESEIRAAFLGMGRNGLAIEPSAAAGMAGLRKVLPSVPKKALVVAFLTGHGFKASEALSRLLA